jgi:hypothetical protein
MLGFLRRVSVYLRNTSVSFHALFTAYMAVTRIFLNHFPALRESQAPTHPPPQFNPKCLLRSPNQQNSWCLCRAYRSYALTLAPIKSCPLARQVAQSRGHNSTYSTARQASPGSVIRAHTNVSQTQLRETGGREIVQSPRFRRNRTSTRPKVRPRKPWCADCNREFARKQEFKRHLKDVHGPSRQCPLCDFKWIRPDKIKAHIVANHQDEFAPEVLDHIRRLCGQQIVAFVDGIEGPYDHDLDINAATFHPSVSQGSSLS